MDIVDKITRARIMRSVPQKNTKPELCLRKALHSRGYRYRLHDRRLSGSPDIVFPKYRGVIFIHGCFWHRHGCKKTTTPSTRYEFWKAKFEANVERDRKNIEDLKKNGWRVLIIWECELNGADISVTVERAIEFLRSV